MLTECIEQDQIHRFADLLCQLKAFEQRRYFDAVIIYTTRQFFQSELISKDVAAIEPSPVVSGAACLLNDLIHNNDILKDYLVSSLTRSTIPSLDESFSIRRAVTAVLAQDEGQCRTLSLLDRH